MTSIQTKTIHLFLILAMLLISSAAFAAPKTEFTAEKLTPRQHSLSLGQGVIYGGFGLKGEMSITDKISLMGAYGVSTMESVSYHSSGLAGSIGFFYTLPFESRNWGTRIGANYGQNQWLEGSSFEGTYRSAFNGYSLSVGSQYQTGNNFSLDLDLIYAIREDHVNLAEVNSPAWMVALGIRRFWGHSSSESDSFKNHPR